MINWKDEKLVKQVVRNATAYSKRKADNKPYSDRKILESVRVIMNFMKIPEDHPIVWLANLKKSSDIPRPANYDVSHSTSQFQNSWRHLDQTLYNLNSKVWSASFGYYVPDDQKAPESVNRVLHRNSGVNGDMNRIAMAVNETGFISSRMRRLVGAITTDHRGYYNYGMGQIYARGFDRVVNLGRHEHAYALGQYHLDELNDTAQQEMKTLLEACKVITTSLFSMLYIHNRMILVELPKIHRNERLQFHREDGPAIEFTKIGAGVYYLNGVRIMKDVVLTPADKLKSELMLKTRNVETRREIVRKIGVEKILNDLDAKVSDEKENYQLVNLDLKDGRNRPYLKMLNPSTGDWHVEGVEPRVTTVDGALAYRNGTNVAPQILT